MVSADIVQRSGFGIIAQIRQTTQLLEKESRYWRYVACARVGYRASVGYGFRCDVEDARGWQSGLPCLTTLGQ